MAKAPNPSNVWSITGPTMFDVDVIAPLCAVLYSIYPGVGSDPPQAYNEVLAMANGSTTNVALNQGSTSSSSQLSLEQNDVFSFRWRSSGAPLSAPGALDVAYNVPIGPLGQASKEVTLLILDEITGNVLESHAEPADRTGKFYYLTNSSPGTYDVKLKMSGTLLKAVRGVTTARDTITSLSFDLVPGDVNNDNIINSSDVAAMQLRLGKAAKDDDWEQVDSSGVSAAVCDLNGDLVVDGADVTIANSNLGLIGD